MVSSVRYGGTENRPQKDLSPEELAQIKSQISEKEEQIKVLYKEQTKFTIILMSCFFIGAIMCAVGIVFWLEFDKLFMLFLGIFGIVVMIAAFIILTPPACKAVLRIKELQYEIQELDNQIYDIQNEMKSGLPSGQPSTDPQPVPAPAPAIK